MRETDLTLECLPLVHIFANASPVFGSLNSGGCVVVLERFQTEKVIDAMERMGANRDLARQDGEGYFFIVGRKDEMFISGG